MKGVGDSGNGSRDGVLNVLKRASALMMLATANAMPVIKSTLAAQHNSSNPNNPNEDVTTIFTIGACLVVASVGLVAYRFTKQRRDWYEARHYDCLDKLNDQGITWVQNQSQKEEIEPLKIKTLGGDDVATVARNANPLTKGSLMDGRTPFNMDTWYIRFDGQYLTGVVGEDPTPLTLTILTGDDNINCPCPPRDLFGAPTLDNIPVKINRQLTSEEKNYIVGTAVMITTPGNCMGVAQPPKMVAIYDRFIYVPLYIFRTLALAHEFPGYAEFLSNASASQPSFPWGRTSLGGLPCHAIRVPRHGNPQ